MENNNEEIIADLLKHYTVNKLDESTVMINNRKFSFMYTIADSVVKDDLKGFYTYIGGLQCGFDEGSELHTLLKTKLEVIAQYILNEL